MNTAETARREEDTRVLYLALELGRDGFWIHRFLRSVGVESHVVDSASIEVKRRGKRRKTDRLDLGALLRLLIRYWGGEKKVWSVVHVPSPEAEDARHLHRDLETLKADRTRVTNRIIHATRGKQVRAEPVAALAEQGRLHHVGDFPELEDELISWMPGMPSPNRLDGLVWAVSELMLKSQRTPRVWYPGMDDGSTAFQR